MRRCGVEQNDGICFTSLLNVLHEKLDAVIP